jgi:hypothetical protein
MDKKACPEGAKRLEGFKQFKEMVGRNEWK